MQTPGLATKNIPVTIDLSIYDGAGSLLPGLSVLDVRVTVLEQDGTNFQGLTLDNQTFVEVGYGRYGVTLSEDVLSRAGVLLIKVTPDPLFAGTMRQTVKPVYVSDAEGLAHGLVQDRGVWLPTFLQVSGAPVGGLSFGDASTSRYKKPLDNVYTPLVLSVNNFRELLDLGQPTGIYQIYLPFTCFDGLGSLVLELDGLTFDAFTHLYPVVKASVRRVFVEAVDNDNDQDPLPGITVYASNLLLGEVVAQAVTDGLGQAVLDLVDGEHRLTLSLGTQIFHENNIKALIQDPDEMVKEATFARLVCGNQGPYNLADGDTLQFSINGGEQQEVTFRLQDFSPPASAEVVAELIDINSHSVNVFAGGLNNTQVEMATPLTGDQSRIQILGGSANSKLNFSMDPVVGLARRRVVNSFQLNGSSYVPAFPAPNTDTVEFTYRVLDLTGRPVPRAEVQIVNKFHPGVVASDGVSSILGRKVLQFFTDLNGVAQDPERGKPRLMKGAEITVILKGTGIARDIVVPQTDFTLMDQVSSAEDLFTVQTPNLPPAPRS